MADIPGSEVWRGGYFSEAITHKPMLNFSVVSRPNLAQIEIGHPAKCSKGRNGFFLSGSIPSKGGGFTTVYFFVPAESFDTVREVMGLISGA